MAKFTENQLIHLTEVGTTLVRDLVAELRDLRDVHEDCRQQVRMLEESANVLSRRNNNQADTISAQFSAITALRQELEASRAHYCCPLKSEVRDLKEGAKMDEALIENLRAQVGELSGALDLSKTENISLRNRIHTLNEARGCLAPREYDELEKLREVARCAQAHANAMDTLALRSTDLTFALQKIQPK